MTKHMAKQEGNILVSSLFILIAMNLLGAGLMQSATRELTSATYKSVDAEVFHITESCVHDVITAFELLEAKPSTDPSVTTTSPTYMTGSTTVETNKLTGYQYDCTTSFVTSKTVSSGTGVSGEVGGSGSEYGGSASLSSLDYYLTVSTGSGPNSAQKVINSLISVEY